MENYELKADEVVLFKGDVHFIGSKDITQLILTNLNVVFITTHKKLFAKDEITVEVFEVNSIKVYQDTPWVKQNKTTVAIYFATTEKEFEFENKKEAHNFVASTLKLRSGKSSAVRLIEKTKQNVNEVAEAIGKENIATAKNFIVKQSPKIPTIIKKIPFGKKSSQSKQQRLTDGINN